MKRYLLVALVVGCRPATPPQPTAIAPVEEVAKAAAVELVRESHAPFATSPPTVERLDVPWPKSTMAVWGSLGRDSLGRILVGASVDAGRDASASLLRYDPKLVDWTNLGKVVDHIKSPVGVSQNKIHTRIVAATNGALYFASMDESGEADDGSLLPTYGSRIWTVGADGRWTMIRHVPEGLIAAAAGGKFVYFLGYFGHVLYQLDTATNELRQTRIGATGGHTSRNLIVDWRGHAFVPRVRSGRAVLVELDIMLEEVTTTPLVDYEVSPTADSHGIVAVATLRDGTVAFLTDGGRLYSIDNGTVTDRSLLHPKGKAYLACLASDGTRIFALGRPAGQTGFDWIERDFTTHATTVKPIAVPVPTGSRSVLVYGSMTRDDAGAWYVGGAFMAPGEKGFTPALWRIR